MTNSTKRGRVADWCARVAANVPFQRVALTLVIGNAILIGIETSAGIRARHADLLVALHAGFQALFVVEIGIRVVAHTPRVQDFFRDGWNLLDFVVVGLGFLPATGQFATVARLARVFRALRVVSALPELRLLVATMLRSIPSLINVALLLLLILYVYGVAGVHLFAATDPEHWGNLARAVLTLFEILTLEGWVDLMDATVTATPLTLPFYVSYVVIAVFVVVNLFIAVVVNNLQMAKADMESAPPRHSIAARLAALRVGLDDLEEAVGPAARR